LSYKQSVKGFVQQCIIITFLIDVQLVNLTELIYAEEGHEVILQCSIHGLNTDETDYDIMFYNVPKCEYYQQQLLGEINDAYSIISSSNGTIRTSKLHILEAKASHSGSYSCKVKLHKDKPEECATIETTPMTVDIGATSNNTLTCTTDNTPTTDNKTTTPAVITGSLLGIGGTILLILISVCIHVCVWKKTHKQPEQVQQQQPQPEQHPPVDEHEQRPPVEPQPEVVDEPELQGPPNVIAQDHHHEHDEQRRLLEGTICVELNLHFYHDIIYPYS
jgi:hypothetical protein